MLAAVLEFLVSTRRCTAFQFATLRTYGRAPLLARGPIKQLLLERLMETRKRFHLSLAAYVLLDDHIHLLIRGSAEQECTAAMNDLRSGVQRTWRKSLPNPVPDAPDALPFWEHGIEYHQANSSEELRAFLEFIHYDPVRHGLVDRPSDYLWSSLPARIEQGHYPEYWGILGPPACIARVARDCATSMCGG